MRGLIPDVGILFLAAAANPAVGADSVLAAQLATRLHEEIAAARVAAGLAPLAWDSTLAAIAAAHNVDMAQRVYFGHTSPDGATLRDRYAAANYECRVQIGQRIHLGAENLAQRRRGAGRDAGQVLRPWPDTAALARDVLADWLESTGHRRNIFAPQWRREGIGVYATATEILVTQNFC